MLIHSSWGKAGVLAVCAATLPGCSFFLVDAPPAKVVPEVYPMCTEARTAPVVDVIVAGSTASFAAESLLLAGSFDDPFFSTEIGLVALAVAAVYAPAAWIGFRRTGECRRLRQIYVERHGEPGQMPAGEAQACHPQAGCQPGLVCASGICVRPPKAPAPPSAGENR